METHDHQPSVDATIPDGPSAVPTENMTTQAQGKAPVSPGPTVQAMPDRPPESKAQAASVDPLVQTTIPDQQGQTVSQSPQAQAAGQQAQFQPNVIMDPGTGQLYYAMPPQGQPVQPPPQNGQYAYHTVQAASVDPSAQTVIPDQQEQTVSQSPQAQAAGQQAQFQPNVIMDPATGQLYYAMPQGQPVQPPPQNGQYVYYTPQTPPEQAPETHQPDYAQIIKSVEDFAEGDASVADVVKTLWAETAQDDQFWKGAVVGAAAAALLTSETMRGAMGKTFGSLFGKNAADAAASSSPAPDINTDTK